MTSTSEGSGARSYWLVGAMYDSEDQTSRFIKDGIWENGYEDRYLDLVKAIRPGDRIAIKAAYTRKRDLPFNNRGQSVSVMAIKAIGTVTENLGDGRKVRVKWSQLDSPREWFFFTHRGTIWRVVPGEWTADALIAFTFENKSQDFRKFQNAPYWRERFGDGATDEHRFQWTHFYEAVADKLLAHQQDRTTLVKCIHEIAGRVNGLSNLQDQYADGKTGPIRDICPFTTMGIFNRGITEANRKKIASELARFLGVAEPVPETFEGIPVLNNQRSWFFGYEKDRKPDDIDILWRVFGAAVDFAKSDDPDAQAAFIKAFDEATGMHGVAWNLTVGLYWIRPWDFATLDQRSRQYLEEKLSLPIGRSGHKHLPSAADYLTLLDSLETRFREEVYAVHSYPELSLAAWSYTGALTTPPTTPTDLEGPEETAGVEVDTPSTAAPIQPYSVDNILADGCFLERAELERLLERLRSEKNLILQGPPGTGKTWLAKRLAFALMGQRDERKLRPLQFHPNLSYEDFVRGWRPTGDGKLSLIDGPFMEMVNAALKAPSSKFVVVIEEINRGNPAQILGEMLTLLEADKRTPTEALELCYRRKDGERVYIPDNLYVIGTMNIADRSLALVDVALRRRFAFVELEPKLGKTWRAWVTRRCGIDSGLLDEIEKRILALNEQIAADTNLGRQFRIGHSYVTPPLGSQITNAHDWFVQAVETKIGPQLDEYWFDAIDRAKEARKRLLEGL